MDSSQLITFVPASFTFPIPSTDTQIKPESTITPTTVDIMGTTTTSGPKRTLYIDAKKIGSGDKESVKKQKVMTSISSTTSTTMPMVSVIVSPTFAHPSGQNPQNSPQTPLMGLGVGYPHGIGGSSYISASATAISPFKHSIVSQNPNFRYNEFVTNYEK